MTAMLEYLQDGWQQPGRRSGKGRGCVNEGWDGPDGDEEDAAWAESPGSLTPVEPPFSGKGEEVAVRMEVVRTSTAEKVIGDELVEGDGEGDDAYECRGARV